jgi:hypothetical protein
LLSIIGDLDIAFKRHKKLLLQGTVSQRRHHSRESTVGKECHAPSICIEQPEEQICGISQCFQQQEARIGALEGQK